MAYFLESESKIDYSMLTDKLQQLERLRSLRGFPEAFLSSEISFLTQLQEALPISRRYQGITYVPYDDFDAACKALVSRRVTNGTSVASIIEVEQTEEDIVVCIGHRRLTTKKLFLEYTYYSSGKPVGRSIY